MGIFYRNIAEQLIREDGNTGRVTAVICKREDGSYAQYVDRKAIVLATGDFSGDRDMMRCCCPETADYVEDDVYDSEPDWDQGFKYGGIYKGQGQIAMAVNVGLGTAARLMRGSRDQNDVWWGAAGAFGW